MGKFFTKHKVIFGATLTLVLGVGTSVMTMAAVPSLASSTITACRDASSGQLRVIDTDNSETCQSGETLLSWSGEQSAVLRIVNNPDDNSDYVGVYSSQYSRGILGAKKVVEGVDGAVTSGYCVHLPFQPLYISSSDAIYDANPQSGSVEVMCGTGYEVFVNCASSCTSSSPYYFSN